MKEIPCRNCLTLSVCKALFEDHRFDSTRSRFTSRLTSKCSLIKTYIHSNKSVIFNIYDVYDFFAEGDIIYD